MSYTVKEKKSLPKSEFLLVLELPTDEISAKQRGVLSRLAKDAELPGFRKGHVPEDMIRSRMGEMALWEESAEEALREALSDFFKTEKMDVIGQPQIQTLKLAPENPAEFKLTLSLYPTLTLPDYRKIAGEENRKPEESSDVSEKEVDTVIAEITKQHTNKTGKKDFSLTEETAKELGEFGSVADLRKKVTEGVTGHKRERLKEKRRAELLDRIIRKAEGDIPEILIESELHRMENELKGEIERFGGTFEAYLKEIKKDPETMRKEWRESAEKRARLQLALFQIAKAENITAPKEQVDAEVKHLLEHYKDATEENARSFVETTILNQQVISFLEQL